MLTDYVKKAEGVLEEKFGFKPIESTVSCYDKKHWKHIIKYLNYPEDTDGFFNIRALKAKVLKESFEETLPTVIHEYLGHGSFCEFSKYGMILTDYEEELKNIEKQLLKDQVKEGSKVQICCSDTNKRILHKNKGNYILECNPKDELINNYLRLQEEHQNIFERNYPYYEGFSVWLEEFLLNNMNMEHIWLKRKEQTPYLEFYNTLKDYENQTGPLTLISKIGFPKRFNDSKIIEIVKENIKDFENIEYLISFGSEKEYSDLNIFVVKKEGETEHIIDENLDFYQIKTSDLEKSLIKTADLSDISTVKNGRLIYGNKKRFEKLRSKTTNIPITPQIREHHRKEAKEMLQYAKYYYKKALKENNPSLLTVSLIDLAYAISYNQCAIMYQNGCKTAQTYQDLIESDHEHIIKNIRHIAKNNPSKEETRNLLEKYKKSI
ncbi:MAG: hypothetical protein L6408_00570 [Nanoarchaeota archaeon]|nr:hypothetical protein [Nanoarchaeota archaeon]